MLKIQIPVIFVEVYAPVAFCFSEMVPVVQTGAAPLKVFFCCGCFHAAAIATEERIHVNPEIQNCG